MKSGEQPSLAKSRPAILFATLMAGQLAQGLVLTAVSPALPELALDLGPQGPFTAQMVMSFGALGLMLGGVISGRIMRRVGTRMTLLWSSLTFAATGGAGLFTRLSAILFISRFCLGIAAACIMTTVLWGLATEYETDRRARAFGIAGALTGASGLLSILLGGVLTRRWGWPLAFVQYPVFGLPLFGLGFIGLRQANPPLDRSRMPGHVWARWLPFYALVTGLFALCAIGGSQFPFMLQQHGFIDPSQRSVVMALPTIGASLSSLAYGRLRERMSNSGILALGLALLAVGLVLIAESTAAVVNIAGGALMGGCIGMVGPSLYNMIAERHDGSARASHMGYLNAFIFLGIFVNPLLAEGASALAGPKGIFVGAAAAAVTLAFLARRLNFPPASQRQG